MYKFGVFCDSHTYFCKSERLYSLFEGKILQVDIQTTYKSCYSNLIIFYLSEISQTRLNLINEILSTEFTL